MTEHPIPKPEPTGIGGWLAILVGALLFINPVMNVGGVLANFSSAEESLPALVDNSTWATYKMIALGGAGIGSAILFLAGVRLIDSKTPKSVDFALTALWVGGLAVPVLTLVLLALVIKQNPIGNEGQFGSMVGGLFWLVVWSLYLTRSKRVKNTYFLGTKG